MADAVAGRLGAVVLTGGTGSRLGGVDKASLTVDGRTLLERSLSATAKADEVVVVGAEVATSRPVRFVREDPPGGGPAAALLAGLDGLVAAPGLVCVLAVDMPWVDTDTVTRLVRTVAGHADADGAWLIDAAGREQPLAAVYRPAALTAVRPPAADEPGLPMWRLVRTLRMRPVAAVGREAHDIDTPADLADLTDLTGPGLTDPS